MDDRPGQDAAAGEDQDVVMMDADAQRAQEHRPRSTVPSINKVVHVGYDFGSGSAGVYAMLPDGTTSETKVASLIAHFKGRMHIGDKAQEVVRRHGTKCAYVSNVKRLVGIGTTEELEREMAKGVHEHKSRVEVEQGRVSILPIHGAEDGEEDRDRKYFVQDVVATVGWVALSRIPRIHQHLREPRTCINLCSAHPAHFNATQVLALCKGVEQALDMCIDDAIAEEARGRSEEDALVYDSPHLAKAWAHVARMESILRGHSPAMCQVKMTTVPEPVAAAIAAIHAGALRSIDVGTYLDLCVVDVGRSATDVACLRIYRLNENTHNVDVLDLHGNPAVGGQDFVQVMVDIINKGTASLPTASPPTASPPTASPPTAAQVQAAAEQMLRELSDGMRDVEYRGAAHPEARICPVAPNVFVTAAAFDERCKHLRQHFRDAVVSLHNRAVHVVCKYRREEVSVPDAILMVGGGTRIFSVRRALKSTAEELARECKKQVDVIDVEAPSPRGNDPFAPPPDSLDATTLVAHGCAILARSHSYNDAHFVLNDRAAMSVFLCAPSRRNPDMELTRVLPARSLVDEPLTDDRWASAALGAFEGLKTEFVFYRGPRDSKMRHDPGVTCLGSIQLTQRPLVPHDICMRGRELSVGCVEMIVKYLPKDAAFDKKIDILASKIASNEAEIQASERQGDGDEQKCQEQSDKNKAMSKEIKHLLLKRLAENGVLATEVFLLPLANTNVHDMTGRYIKSLWEVLCDNAAARKELSTLHDTIGRWNTFTPDQRSLVRNQLQDIARRHQIHIGWAP